jgi:hypothetical protein
MFRAVVSEMPTVLALSLASTAVAVIVTFRRGGLPAARGGEVVGRVFLSRPPILRVAGEE